MRNDESAEAKVLESISDQLTQDSNVHLNLSNDLIVITEDKLRLCLREQGDAINESRSWTAPVSMLITLSIVLLTTSFNEAFFPASTWQAVFVICWGGAILWTIKAVKDSGGTKRSTDDIVDELKAISTKK